MNNGRPDVVRFLIERAKRSAEKKPTEPGVSKDSPKYAGIKETLARAKQEAFDKVKRLENLPDQAISLQYHKHRSEHWTIVQGEGKVIVDGSIFTVKKGESFHVPKLSLHKIANTHLTETLIAIEVQMGEICSEDDIVRC
jgi:mannose-6-phosphate isomerase-like protein (cupin superfamily)